MSTALDASNAASGEDLSAVAWVAGELQRALDAAHKALRRFLKETQAAATSDVDAPDSAILRQARVQIHQSVGALELVGLPLPAKVLRASEAAVQRIAGKPALLDAAGLEALENASFAVIDFLNRMLARRPVAAVALFPQYRAVQALAGADRVHPADLWDTHWRWQPLLAEVGVDPRPADDAARGEMEGLVLSVMRGASTQVRPVAERLSELCAQLAAGASSSMAVTSWQLAAAFFQAQAEGLLDLDVFAKRMASRLLAQLRANVRTGDEISELLASDLLFFCARARPPQAGQAPRLEAVRQAWELSDSGAGTDYETARLGRFDPAWLAQARKRVVSAKDVWSAVSGGDARRLSTLAEPFALLGDSLQRLFPGGDALATALQAAAGQTMVSGGAPGTGLAMEVATAVLWIDAALEEGALDTPELAERVRHVAQRIDQAREGGEVQPLEPWIEELYRRVSDQQTMGSVVHELRASLTEVEKSIDQFFRNPRQRDVLMPVSGQLQAMRGVLSLLDLQQASAAVVHMRNQVDELAATEIDPALALQAGTFDRLADNLGTLGFLIDMLSVQPNLARSLFHFDAEQGRLLAETGGAPQPSGFGGLGPPSPVALQPRPSPEPAVPEPAALDATRAVPPVLADGSFSFAFEPTLAQAGGDAAASGTSPASTAATPAVPPLPAPVAAATGLEDDDEMRGIFLEEAREVVANAREALQALTANSEDMAEMTTVRRAFHTLKGSSRMVGLREFGEAAWGCEQLYNARLASDPRVDLGLAEFTRRAFDELEQWVEDIDAKRDAQRSSKPLVAQADALRLGRTLEVVPEAPNLPSPPAALPPASIEPPAASDAALASLPDIAELPDLSRVPAAADEPMTVFEALVEDHFDIPPTIRIEPTRPAEAPKPVEAPALPLPEIVDEDTLGIEATEVFEGPADRDFDPPTQILPRPTPEPSLLLQVPDLPSAADLDLGFDATQRLRRVDDLSRAAPGVSAAPTSPEGEPPMSLSEPLPDIPEVLEILDVGSDLAHVPLPEVTEALEPQPEPQPELTLDLADLVDEHDSSAPGAATPAPLAPEPGTSPFERTAVFDGSTDSGVDAAVAPADPQVPAGPVEAAQALDLADPISPLPVRDEDAAFVLDLGEVEAPADEAIVIEPGGAEDAVVAVEPTADEAASLTLDLSTPANDAAVADEGVKVIGSLRIAIPLFNIFLNEADEQSRRLVTELAEWALEWRHSPVSETAEALAHSLAGNSATVGYSDLSTLARALEHAMGRSRLNSHGRDGESELFGDAAEEIRRLLHQFAAGFLKPAPQELLDRLADHEHWPLLESSDDRDESTDAMSQEALLERVELRDDAAAISVPPAVMQEPDSFEPSRSDDDDDLEGISDEIDADLLPIFLEEAEELLPQLQQHVGQWIAHPADRSAADGAMRNLHTFKGGARLAGAMRVGELAHRLETSIEQLIGADEVQAEALEPLQSQVDRVAAMFDELRHPGVAAAPPEMSQPVAAVVASSGLAVVATDSDDAEASPDALPMDEARTVLGDLGDSPGAATMAGAIPDGMLDLAPDMSPVDTGATAAMADTDDPALDAAAAAAAAVAALALPAPASGPDELAGMDAVDTVNVDLDEATPAAADAMAAPAEAASVIDSLAAAAGEHPAAAVVVAESEPVAETVAVPDEPAAPVAAPLVPIDWSRFGGARVGAAASAAVSQAAPLAASGVVRVRAGLLDRLVNGSGEVSIARARIEADVGQLQGSLGELTGSLERMRRELRDIELQAETQISARIEAAKASAASFDPLEMDRFTRLQELTRMMAESVNDVATLQRSLQRTLQSTEDQLAAQARLTRELQDDLLRTRMTEFESLADRLYRVVRQASRESGKQVKLEIVGGSIEVDRGVLERMAGPFEHLLRNGVAHGIESPDDRVVAGKDRSGSIRVAVTQAGNEVVVEFADDGAGLNLARIRERALERGLVAADAQPSDDELARMIFLPGFSTASSVTELAGRGVGMDVVRSEVTAMGGRIETHTQAGRGTTFRLVLPLTTAVTQVVMLRCGLTRVAVPSTLVEVVRRVPTADVAAAYEGGRLLHETESVPFFWLAALVDGDPPADLTGRTQAVVISRSAAQRVALHVDEVEGNQEVVVKNLGPQLARMPGLAGVTLLPSGDVALIYNPVAMAALHADAARARQHRAPVVPATAAVAEDPAAPVAAAREVPDLPPLVMVVDDSLTVRRVTQRLLEREGYRVVMAKDGIEALERLDGERPRVMLCDIEMPRMDGFELVRTMRADPLRQGIPVVMITSRIAQKHRDHAASLGVEHYLGKPFSEDQLLALVSQYCAEQVASV